MPARPSVPRSAVDLWAFRESFHCSVSASISPATSRRGRAEASAGPHDPPLPQPPRAQERGEGAHEHAGKARHGLTSPPTLFSRAAPASPCCVQRNIFFTPCPTRAGGHHCDADTAALARHRGPPQGGAGGCAACGAPPAPAPVGAAERQEVRVDGGARHALASGLSPDLHITSLSSIAAALVLDQAFGARRLQLLKRSTQCITEQKGEQYLQALACCVSWGAAQGAAWGKSGRGEQRISVEQECKACSKSATEEW